MKSLFSSTTIRGALLSILCSLIALKCRYVDAQEVHGIIDGLLAMWKPLLGIIAAIGAAWHRVQAFHFDKSLVYSKTFWCGIGVGVLAIANAFGIDTTGWADIGNEAMALIAQGGPIIGAIFIVVGRAKAKQRITIQRAQPLA